MSIEQWRDPLGASRQLLDNISNLLNSNENFEIDDSLTLDVTHITMPSGLPKGKRKRHTFSTDNYGDFLRSKRGVVRIMNHDELCCARAIVVAKAMVDPQLKVIKDSRKPLQKQLAQSLHEEARVLVGPCGLQQIKLFEIVLKEYQFVVVSAEHGHAIVHKGPQTTTNKSSYSCMMVILMSSPNSLDFFIPTIFAFNAKKPTTQKSTAITPVKIPNVTHAYNPIAVTTISLNTRTTEPYHARIVVVVFTESRAN